MKKSIYIKILEWGTKKTEGFERENLHKELKLKEWEQKILRKHFENADYNHGTTKPRRETLFTKVEDKKYIINLNAQFQYIDYLELKSAQRNARLAFIVSALAFFVSLIGNWDKVKEFFCELSTVLL